MSRRVRSNTFYLLAILFHPAMYDSASLKEIFCILSHILIFTFLLTFSLLLRLLHLSIRDTYVRIAIIIKCVPGITTRMRRTNFCCFIYVEQGVNGI